MYSYIILYLCIYLCIYVHIHTNIFEELIFILLQIYTFIFSTQLLACPFNVLISCCFFRFSQISDYGVSKES